MADWKPLTTIEALDVIVEQSKSRPQLIFKHSTRCSISSGAKSRLTAGIEALGKEMDLHYLDLITYRPVSNAIAAKFGVIHESPQVIVVKDGKSVLDMSHSSITAPGILGRLA